MAPPSLDLRREGSYFTFFFTDRSLLEVMVLKHSLLMDWEVGCFPKLMSFKFIVCSIGDMMDDLFAFLVVEGRTLLRDFSAFSFLIVVDNLDSSLSYERRRG